ncbi:MAG: HNH endonuclease, partial [Planctomycetes bacterium]|nr:HNH endonuclease [Planctomycetota bacterium]
MAEVRSPQTLLRLIEESGAAFAVVEDAVETLRLQVGDLAPGDPDAVAILRHHLLAIGSPSDVAKYFSLELLTRLAPERADATFLEVVEQLARSPIQPDRTYPVERAMIRQLGEREVTEALPALAVLAAREVYPLSRSAARAVAKIVGSTDQDVITDRLKRDDLPEASRPQELSAGVNRALWPSRKSSSARSSQERRRKITQENAESPPDSSQTCLRPESKAVRQRRLRAVLLGAGRDPSRCGNCGQAGRTEIGHLLPPNHGGSDRPGNLFSLCGPCRRRLPRGRREGFEEHAVA